MTQIYGDRAHHVFELIQVYKKKMEKFKSMYDLMSPDSLYEIQKFQIAIDEFIARLDTGSNDKDGTESDQNHECRMDRLKASEVNSMYNLDLIESVRKHCDQFMNLNPDRIILYKESQPIPDLRKLPKQIYTIRHEVEKYMVESCQHLGKDNTLENRVHVIKLAWIDAQDSILFRYMLDRLETINTAYDAADHQREIFIDDIDDFPCSQVDMCPSLTISSDETDHLSEAQDSVTQVDLGKCIDVTNQGIELLESKFNPIRIRSAERRRMCKSYLENQFKTTSNEGPQDIYAMSVDMHLQSSKHAESRFNGLHCSDFSHLMPCAGNHRSRKPVYDRYLYGFKGPPGYKLLIS